MDKVYERLAEKAQELIKNDPGLNPHYHETGFTFCVDGNPGPLNTLWEAMLDNVQKNQPIFRWEELKSHDDIYRSLHGEHAIPDAEFRGIRAWKKGYTSKRCAVVNAEAMVKIYYERCRATNNIHFELGSPVDQLLYTEDHDAVDGVVLENGRALYAERLILAAGPWTSRLVKLEDRMHANAVPIVYIKLTPSEYEQYKNISCHTNLITGMNIFTPIGGLLKILRRTTSLRNTTILKDPEDPSKTYEASYPRTKLDDPSQAVPLEIEQSIRAELREIFPQVADRPFYNTKFCW
jgi:sarcosine oxidase/L-pipecolate oxidase